MKLPLVTAPTSAITSGPASLTTNSSATFVFAGTDPTSGGVSSGVNHLEYSLDGGSYVTATSPLTLSGLADGSHTFQVRAVDNAGNIGAPTSETWTVDSTPPTVTLTAPADGSSKQM